MNKTIFVFVNVPDEEVHTHPHSLVHGYPEHGCAGKALQRAVVSWQTEVNPLYGYGRRFHLG